MKRDDWQLTRDWSTPQSQLPRHHNATRHKMAAAVSERFSFVFVPWEELETSIFIYSSESPGVTVEVQSLAANRCKVNCSNSRYQCLLNVWYPPGRDLYFQLTVVQVEEGLPGRQCNVKGRKHWSASRRENENRTWLWSYGANLKCDTQRWKKRNDAYLWR